MFVAQARKFTAGSTSLCYFSYQLHDRDLVKVLRCPKTDPSQERFRHLVTAVITYQLSYIIKV
jgi:hypothetical protein